MALHPREDLGRGGKRPEGRRRPRGRAQTCRRPRGEDVPRGGRRDQRSDEMRAAALVLPRARLAVLVTADRDVLGAVVGRELLTAQGEQRRCEREQARDELLRGVAEPRAPHALQHDRAAEHRDEDARALERQPRLGQPPPHPRQERERLEDLRRPAQDRIAHVRADQSLALGRDLQLAALRADRARPRGRPVHEHAVRERHPAEVQLLRHRLKRTHRASSSRRWRSTAAGPRESSRPSTATTGTTSRTAELANASSARSSWGSVNEPSRTR